MNMINEFKNMQYKYKTIYLRSSDTNVLLVLQSIALLALIRYSYTFFLFPLQLYSFVFLQQY